MFERCIVSVCNKNPNLILMREVEMAQLAAGSWASAPVLGYAQPVRDPILPRFNQSTWQALEGEGVQGQLGWTHENTRKGKGRVRLEPRPSRSRVDELPVLPPYLNAWRSYQCAATIWVGFFDLLIHFRWRRTYIRAQLFERWIALSTG